MTPYKALVRQHVQPLVDAGMTQREIAKMLGIDSHNFLGMVLSATRPDAHLPMKRLPALAELCALTGTECLQLVEFLAADGRARAVQFDVPTFEWLVASTARALKEAANGA